MQYTIGVDEEFLRVQVSGRDTDRPPSDLCAAILDHSRKLERNCVLIELDQKSPLSPTSQFQLVARLPEIGFTPAHRIALVHRTPAMQEANEFINLLAANRSINVRSFPAVEDAKTWLRALDRA